MAWTSSSTRRALGRDTSPVTEMSDEEIEQKLSVHFQGAVWATQEAARIMREQGRGGRLVYNASKAAFAPGEGFAAYGASKAALVHYVRNVANELGRDGITANYINADAVDTPLFRDLVRERAKLRGKTEEEMLASYAERSVLRTRPSRPKPSPKRRSSSRPIARPTRRAA